MHTSFYCCARFSSWHLQRKASQDSEHTVVVSTQPADQWALPAALPGLYRLTSPSPQKSGKTANLDQTSKCTMLVLRLEGCLTVLRGLCQCYVSPVVDSVRLHALRERAVIDNRLIAITSCVLVCTLYQSRASTSRFLLFALCTRRSVGQFPFGGNIGHRLRCAPADGRIVRSSAMPAPSGFLQPSPFHLFSIESGAGSDRQ